MDTPPSDPPPGQLVRRLRDQAGLTQAQFAHQAGVAQSVVSKLERGGTATVDMLARLLQPLGLQLRLDSQPLIDQIDAALDAEEGRSVQERFEDLGAAKHLDGFDLAEIDAGLEHVPHVYTGLTAAALLGAPVRPTLCELVLLNDEAALDQFAGWLSENWARRWDVKLGDYSGFLTIDPSEPGALRWETFIGCVSARIVDEFPPNVRVTLKDRDYQVVGLAHLDADDPHVQRVLDRVRMRLTSTG